MKIGITCYPTYGGSGAVATELGLELARRGHEVHFVSYAQPFRLTTFRPGIFFHEVEMMPYPLFEYPPYSLALAVALHGVTREHGLDLLHVHYAVPHATSAWVAREMLRADGSDVRIITTLHGTDITLVGQDASFQPITRFSIERSDGLTAVSEHLKARTIETFGCEGRRIRVIPNFVDPGVYDRGATDCHRRDLAEPGEKIVMHISNFRKVKRVDDVVRVFARISRSLPARLVLIGDGPERALAARTAEEEGVEERTLFLGKLESVAPLLACADLFLLPSEEESFGLVALEAQASGVPVVGSSGSGLEEVLERGTTGWLHPVGDVEAMAASAVRVLEDGDLWRRTSEAARERASGRFSAERVVPLYEAYYREVLEGGGA
ncbi:MAG TPA: N-acetyl-alpha-D-glucosaminyl L-malate synthase BshA [Gemmatimonadota bacterium]|nr:N-acetyl-alpha-D-glucosaminyl L-malate synthase BshA [Gemmatimonadota bacterium]